MKTVLITFEFPPLVGGVENYYKNLADHWPEEFIVLDNHDNKLLNKKLLFFKWLPSLKVIFSTLKTLKPDWLIVGDILPLGTATWLISFFISFKYAVILHGLDFSKATNSSWKRFLSKRILKTAKIIICANSRTAELVIAFIGSDKKVKIVNPGINSQPPIIRPELMTGLRSNYDLTGKQVLLSIGRLIKRKNVADVLMVLPEILQTNPKLCYIILGNGPEEDNIKKLINDEELKGKAWLLNDVSDEEKWAWLELCDVFVMPTKEINGDYEGFGIVYLEANLLAKPVIATRSGGVSDAVIDGLNGRLIEPGDATGLKQAIIELTTNQALSTQLGEQGKARALNDFLWTKQVQKIYDLLKSY